MKRLVFDSCQVSQPSSVKNCHIAIVGTNQQAEKVLARFDDSGAQITVLGETLAEAHRLRKKASVEHAGRISSAGWQSFDLVINCLHFKSHRHARQSLNPKLFNRSQAVADVNYTARKMRPFLALGKKAKCSIWILTAEKQSGPK
jgi:hypothetical protein